MDHDRPRRTRPPGRPRGGECRERPSPDAPALLPVAAILALCLVAPGAGLLSRADPADGAGAASLRILKPKPVEILSGPQAIVVAPPEADPSQAATIEILVDGKVVARIERPPYETTFDFGQSLAPRTIAARISAGPRAGLAAEIRTRGFDARKVDDVARVDLVTLYVSVRSTSGKYVTDLPKDSFRIFEGGSREELVHFGVERRPLVVAILMDASFSMRGEPIEAARDAAVRFVGGLAPEDRAMVLAFSDDPKILVEPTADRARITSAIRSIEAKGGTALYDAIYQASDRLSREEGRKVIVLLSDGRDEAQSGIEPGSLHTFEEALEKALRSEAILFTVGFGKQVEKEMDFYGRTPLKEILNRLATDSGGSFHFPQRTSQLKTAYELIGEELHNQYSLAYAPNILRPDGSWHPIRVEVSDPSLRVFTRRGYYAPKG